MNEEFQAWKLENQERPITSTRPHVDYGVLPPPPSPKSRKLRPKPKISTNFTTGKTQRKETFCRMMPALNYKTKTKIESREHNVSRLT